MEPYTITPWSLGISAIQRPSSSRSNSTASEDKDAGCLPFFFIILFYHSIALYCYSMNVEPAKRQFLEYIEIERGRAVKTIENYDRYLSRYFVHMKIKRRGRHHRAERPRVPPLAQPPIGDWCRLDETPHPELLHDCAPRISEVSAEARYRGNLAREDRARQAPRAPARPHHPHRTRAPDAGAA